MKPKTKKILIISSIVAGGFLLLSQGVPEQLGGGGGFGSGLRFNDDTSKKQDSPAGITLNLEAPDFTGGVDTLKSTTAGTPIDTGKKKTSRRTSSGWSYNRDKGVLKSNKSGLGYSTMTPKKLQQSLQKSENQKYGLSIGGGSIDDTSKKQNIAPNPNAFGGGISFINQGGF